jgi:hypothetical protein
MQTYYPLVWITFIVCLFLVWFFTHRANHKERMMMMEKGLDLPVNKKKPFGSAFPWKKIGIVIIGLSVGLLLITLFVALEILQKGGDALPVAILAFFGGISLVIANYVKGDKGQD